MGPECGNTRLAAMVCRSGASHPTYPTVAMLIALIMPKGAQSMRYSFQWPHEFSHLGYAHPKMQASWRFTQHRQPTTLSGNQPLC